MIAPIFQLEARVFGRYGQISDPVQYSESPAQVKQWLLHIIIMSRGVSQHAWSTEILRKHRKSMTIAEQAFLLSQFPEDFQMVMPFVSNDYNAYNIKPISRTHCSWTSFPSINVRQWLNRQIKPTSCEFESPKPSHCIYLIWICSKLEWILHNGLDGYVETRKLKWRDIEKWGSGGEVVQELKDVIWKVSEKERR